MKPWVLKQLNVINRQCLVIVYTTVYAVVCLDFVLVSCHTYIMEKHHKTRYDVTFISFMEQDFCAIYVYYTNLKPNVSESH